jgi:putative membrane protein
MTMVAPPASMMQKLQGLNGQEFAKQDMDDQVRAHKDAVFLFERYGKAAIMLRSESWATQTSPALQHHLDMAQQLDKLTCFPTPSEFECLKV